MTRPEPATWPAGAATGVGSMPGTDVAEALRVVLGELPDLPFLPELPARGPGADMIGRGAALLSGVYVDLQPSGWRVVSRPGLDSRRAADLLERDLDALAELAADRAGPLKLQAAGPWTLAATVEKTRGDKLLADPGAVRDLGQSLAEGLAGHVAEVARRVPGARLLVQLDEPMLPRVLAGRVATASGFGMLPRPDEPAALDVLRHVVRTLTAAGAVPLVHCCAARPPLRLVSAAGAGAVSVDLAGLTPDRDDELGEAVEAGLVLLAGAVPAAVPPPDPAAAAAPVRSLWRRLGLPAERLPTAVVLTPTCGLAAVSPEVARDALRCCREAARQLAEAPA